MSETVTTGTSTRGDARARVVAAAADLLRDGGAAAVTTRRVAEAAGVQAPALYRLFGDKDGLLDAVTEHVLAHHVSAKAGAAEDESAADADPVADLRAGWRRQIGFGLAHPAVFALLSDPVRARRSPAALAGLGVLRQRVHRVAAAGRLRVGEQHAVDLVHAAGTGAVQTLLATPPEHRDPRLAEALLDAVLAAVLTDAPRAGQDGPDGPDGAEAQDGTVAAAVALRAAAPRLGALTGAERGLLAEWLDRVVDDAASGPARPSPDHVRRAPVRGLPHVGGRP